MNIGPSPLPQQLSTPPTFSDADPRQVADGFEAMFLTVLLEPLKESGAFFGEGPAGRTFGGLFTQQLADQMAVTRPLGVGDQIERSLLQRMTAVESYRKEPK